MTLKQEIRKILKEKATGIVDERILPETFDRIAEWTDKLLEKFTTLDGQDSKLVERTYNRIYTDLVGETIRQIIKYQYARKK